MIYQVDVVQVPHTFLILLKVIIYPKCSHWQKIQCAILLYLSNLRPKTKFHFKVLGAFLVVSDVPSSLVKSIIPHGNRIWLDHIQLYQVPFSMCWPYICAPDKNILYFELSMSLLSCLSNIWSPVLSSSVSYVYLIPLHVRDNKGYPDIWLLHHLIHQHWSHYQALYLTKNHILVHMHTWCLPDGIFSILDADSFTFLPDLYRPSQKGNICDQYDLGVAFYRTL